MGKTGDQEGWRTESRRRFLWENLGAVLEIGGAEVLGKEISDRELVHARASLLSVWFGQEDGWKCSVVIPAEMHSRGREVCDPGEFTPGPQQRWLHWEIRPADESCSEGGKRPLISNRGRRLRAWGMSGMTTVLQTK